MYFTPPVKKRDFYSSIAQAEANALIRANPRAYFDYDLRMRILNAKDGDRLIVANSLTSAQKDYWNWYADTLKVTLNWVSLNGDTIASYFNAPTFSVLQFTSASSKESTGGIESTITSETLYNAHRVHILNCDYDHATYGMIEGYLAILGPTLGAQITVLGDERYTGDEDRSAGEFFSSRFAIEQTEMWWRAWNNYLSADSSQPSVQSVVGCWTKEELFHKAIETANWSALESCNNSSGPGQWCGDCWKCGVTYLWLKHVRSPQADQIPAPTERLRQQMLAEYQDYLNGRDLFRSTGILTPVLYLLK
jgi:hypothetical protein